ncbi:MAG: hypothetical protein HRT93_10865 [Piscirickettsiaceae bacterium]|nr:hypothetical protein [Piscirickettsiaceae bacterium]
MANQRNSNQAGISLEDNLGLVHMIAGKIFRRVSGMSLTLEYEDVFQELAIAYMKAYEGFDSTRGYKFSAYFTKVAFRWANKLIEKECRQEIDMKEKSLDSMFDTQMGVEGSAAPPEKIVEAMELFETVYERLSPLAKKSVDLAIESPPELIRELEMREVKTDVAIETGSLTRHVRASKLDTAISLVLMLCNVSKYKRGEIKKEIGCLAHIIG